MTLTKENPRYSTFPIQFKIEWTAPVDLYDCSENATVEEVRKTVKDAGEALWSEWGLEPVVVVGGKTFPLTPDSVEDQDEIEPGKRHFHIKASGEYQVSGDMLWHPNSKKAQSATLEEVIEYLCEEADLEELYREMGVWDCLEDATVEEVSVS